MRGIPSCVRNPRCTMMVKDMKYVILDEKNGGFPSQTKLFRHFAIQPSFLRSSHTRSSSTFKDMDMKYRILISVGRLNISDISAARVAAFWLLLCYDLQWYREFKLLASFKLRQMSETWGTNASEAACNKLLLFPCTWSQRGRPQQHRFGTSKHCRWPQSQQIVWLLQLFDLSTSSC